VGQEADYADGLLRFWKGPYFASIQARRETGPAKEAMLAMGRSIADAMGEEGKRPLLVDRLPAEGQRPETLRYLRTWPTLDHHLRLGMDNPLRLSRQTALAMASYGEGAPPLHALVVHYPNARLAKEAKQALLSRQEGPPALARVCDVLLFAAVGGKEEEDRQRLFDRLQAQACPDAPKPAP